MDGGQKVAFQELRFSVDVVNSEPKHDSHRPVIGPAKERTPPSVLPISAAPHAEGDAFLPHCVVEFYCRGGRDLAIPVGPSNYARVQQQKPAKNCRAVALGVWTPHHLGTSIVARGFLKFVAGPVGRSVGHEDNLVVDFGVPERLKEARGDASCGRLLIVERHDDSEVGHRLGARGPEINRYRPGQKREGSFSTVVALFPYAAYGGFQGFGPRFDLAQEKV